MEFSKAPFVLKAVWFLLRQVTVPRWWKIFSRSIEFQTYILIQFSRNSSFLLFAINYFQHLEQWESTQNRAQKNNRINARFVENLVHDMETWLRIWKFIIVNNGINAQCVKNNCLLLQAWKYTWGFTPRNDLISTTCEKLFSNPSALIRHTCGTVQKQTNNIFGRNSNSNIWLSFEKNSLTRPR